MCSFTCSDSTSVSGSGASIAVNKPGNWCVPKAFRATAGFKVVTGTSDATGKDTTMFGYGCQAINACNPEPVVCDTLTTTSAITLALTAAASASLVALMWVDQIDSCLT